MASLRNWLERSLLWRVWERMLEIEFVDRSIALAGKGFAAFFPLLIVVAAYLPPGARAAVITSVTVMFGVRGEALTLAREAFASADDVRQATSFLGLVTHDSLRHLVHDRVAALISACAGGVPLVSGSDGTGVDCYGLWR